MFERLEILWERLGSYSLLEVVSELLIIWLVVYLVIRFVQGTRAAGALKSMLLILVGATLAFRVLGGGSALERLSYLYERFAALMAIALIVIFQPELRRGLIRLGEARLFAGRGREAGAVVEPIVTAAAYLAKQRMGALIVIEREIGLRGLVEGGTDLDARLSARLIQTIFFPGSALHDLAVVVRGTTVRQAGVQLPLADPADMPDPTLGARHRAAVGLTKECDAVVVVVSEETGSIRLAQRGRLSRPYGPDELSRQLTRRLEMPPGIGPGRAAERADGEEPSEDAAFSGGPAAEDLGGGGATGGLGSGLSGGAGGGSGGVAGGVGGGGRRSAADGVKA